MRRKWHRHHSPDRTKILAHARRACVVPDDRMDYIVVGYGTSVGNGSTDGESDLGDVVSLPLCWCLFEVEDEDGGIFFFFFFFGERFSDFSLKVFSFFFFLTAFLRAFLSLVSVFMSEEDPGLLSSLFRNASNSSDCQELTSSTLFGVAAGSMIQSCSQLVKNSCRQHECV